LATNSPLQRKAAASFAVSQARRLVWGRVGGREFEMRRELTDPALAFLERQRNSEEVISRR
jgi:hypothetical protein